MKQQQIINRYNILFTIVCILITLSYYYDHYTNGFTLSTKTVTQLQLTTIQRRQRCKYYLDTNPNKHNRRLICYNTNNDDDEDDDSNINTQRIQNKSQKELNVFIFTFPNLYPTTTTINNNTTTNTTTATATTKLLKQWKYYILGDGGVYFDQRPKTLISLNQCLLEYIMKELLYGIENTNNIVIDNMECAVISTCKRFEILITYESRKNMTDMIDIKNEIKSIIASFLMKQIQSKRKRLKVLSYLPFTTIPWDKPSRIKSFVLNQYGYNYENRRLDDTLKSNIENEIIIINGTSQVAERLILLASGLLDRPIFRPFSSRDAHIMSQIKGTSEASQRYSLPNAIDMKNHTITSMTWNKNTKYTKLLFDCALQGGKASRSPKVVPILDELRSKSIGADGPLDLSIKAAESAKILAVQPTLQSCLERLKAMEASEKIKNLHDHVLRVVMKNGINVDVDKEWGRQINKILHKPTVDLRLGRDVDVEQVIMNIEDRISLDNMS